MDLADSPRQDDLDGRGVAIDQVEFMSSLFDLENLSRRLRIFVGHHSTLKSEAVRLLEEALIRGQIERGEASRISGLPERSARRLLNECVAEGLLASPTPKGPVSLQFPAHSLETLFPRLYSHA